MAIHPSRIEAINHASTPLASEVAWTEREKPEAGVIQLDERMLDLPHLKLALSILESAERQIIPPAN